MVIRSAYLLGIHPTTAEAGARISSPNEADLDLLVYLPGGLTSGGFTLRNLSAGLPEFWKARIEQFYVQYSPDKIGPYTLNLSIAHLKPAALLELAQLKTEFPQRVNELYGTLFPPARSPRHSGGHAYPSILFCQPGSSELSRSAEDLASDAVALMAFESCAVLPAVLQNALFAGGPYSAWEYESVGAFALEEPPSGRHVAIPRVVREFLRYQSLIFILEDLHERADRVSFVRKTFGEYLSGLAGTSRRAPPYSKRFLRFLKDWEQAAMELKAIEDLMRVTDAETVRNGFASTHSTASPLRVRMPPLIRGSIIDLVAQEYRNAKTQVTNDLTIGTDRQKSVGDYLRDAANSEATLANLGLQRLVIVLTVLTVLVGLIALITGLLTDEQKKELWLGKPPALHAAPVPPATRALPK